MNLFQSREWGVEGIAPPVRRCLAFAGVLLALTLHVVALAQAETHPVRVELDGRELQFDVPAQVIGGRTMVPFRAIFEALGAQVSWDPASGEITAVRGEDSLKLTAGSRVVEWRQSILQVDVPPVIVAGRTLVPLRFIGQALGLYVGWNNATRTVSLQSRPPDPALALGIRIVHEKSCMVCHTMNGVGGNIGPVLNGVTNRFTPAGIRAWLKDPQKVRPGSRMPNFQFTPDEIEAVVSYLRSLED